MNLLAHGRKEGHFVVLNHGLNKTVILFLATWLEISKKREKKKERICHAMVVEKFWLVGIINRSIMLN